MYDVVVIGAGVIGSAVARELSRYRLKTVVLEKEEDVSFAERQKQTAPSSMPALMRNRIRGRLE